MAVASMLCVQLGLAASVGFIDDLGAAGAAWIRLFWAGILLLVIVRPRLSLYSREALWSGARSAWSRPGVTLLFMAAVARLPLGTASALEFLGPWRSPCGRSRGVGRAWAALAAVGVLLPDPAVDRRGRPGRRGLRAGRGRAAGRPTSCSPSGSATPSAGSRGLAISMPVAALVATLVAGPGVVGHLTPQLLLSAWAWRSCCPSCRSPWSCSHCAG